MMISLELVRRIDELLNRLAPMQLWKYIAIWAEGFEQQRPNLYYILSDPNPQHGKNGGVRDAFHKFIPTLKEPILSVMHREIAEAQNALKDFLGDEAAEDEILLISDLWMITLFERNYEAFVKTQSTENAGLLLDSASHLHLWYESLKSRLGLIATWLRREEKHGDRVETLGLIFDQELDVSEIIDVLSKINSLYATLANIFGQDIPLRPIKIETGSLGAFVVGSTALIIAIRKLLTSDFFNLFTTKAQLNLADDKVKHAKKVLALIKSMKADGLEVSTPEEKLTELADAVVENSIAIIKLQPRILIDGKWSNPDDPRSVRALQIQNNSVQKQFE